MLLALMRLMNSCPNNWCVLDNLLRLVSDLCIEPDTRFKPQGEQLSTQLVCLHSLINFTGHVSNVVPVASLY